MASQKPDLMAFVEPSTFVYDPTPIQGKIIGYSKMVLKQMKSQIKEKLSLIQLHSTQKWVDNVVILDH